MATPKAVAAKVRQYLNDEATWEEVKALVAETTFTHRDKPVYGEDSYIDPSSWEDTIGVIFKLPAAKESELKALAKFV